MTEKKEALIVVKTYPTPATKGVEVSCTAAITRAGEWLRLFPVPFRRLDQDQRFRRYQWVEVSITKASDPRPESYKLDWAGSGGSPIKILGEPLPTDGEWRARKEIVFPLKANSMCQLRADLDKQLYPTLGLFKPRLIQRLVIEDDDPAWSADQLAILRQGSLFEKEENPPQELEKVPFKFSYQFQCDEVACSGHTMKCTDWEMGEAWRSWKAKYGENGWREKFIQRFETDMIERNDTHFYVGTLNQYPKAWIIVGLFYPPNPGPQGNLFSAG